MLHSRVWPELLFFYIWFVPMKRVPEGSATGRFFWPTRMHRELNRLG